MVEASGSRLSQEDDQEAASGKSTPLVSSSKYSVARKYFYSSCRKMWQKCLKTLLTHTAQIATKVACFSRLLKCLRSLYGKQCGPRSDCSYRSSLFWVHDVCFYTLFVSNVWQLFAADDFSRQHFQMHFFLGA